MKKSIKYSVLNVLFAVYEPVITRIEKFRASMMWREGVKQCRKMKKEVGSPRVYLLYDEKHRVWSPMTYEPNKAMKPSLRMLRRMGKARGIARISSVAAMKKFSYYYTSSQWGAKDCAHENWMRLEKLALWTAYYMTHLSEPMQKCREYRQRAEGYCHSHHH